MNDKFDDFDIGPQSDENHLTEIWEEYQRSIEQTFKWVKQYQENN